MHCASSPVVPYGPRSWYPHLSPAEAQIWGVFVAAYPDAYDEVAYDVKCGSVPEMVAEHEDEAIRAEAPLFQYKIDVVGFKDGRADIIELKQRATPRALGQVVSYAHLYERDVDPASRPRPVVITDEAMPDMPHLAARAGVRLIVV